MNSKIVYLLGSGASAQSIPIVKNTMKEFDKFKSEVEVALLQGIRLDSSHLGQIKEIKKNNQILNDIEWIKENAKSEVSYDTFAKLLYNRKEYINLIRLKSILSFFYIIKQLDNPDPRYNHFLLLRTLDNKISNISNKIRVLSWNYDYQIEKSCSNIFGINDLGIIQELLNITPSPNRENPWNKTEDKFEVVKLNGTTAFKHIYSNEISNSHQMLNENDKNKLIKKINTDYSDNKLRPLLSFAWEQKEDSPLLKHAIEIAKMTSILVVIGYSFPEFNRDIDKLLIRNMKNLKKVYIQDLNPSKINREFSSIYTSIFNTAPKDVNEIEDIEKFYLT